MRKSRWSPKKLGVKLTALGLILAGVFLAAEAGFRPLIEEMNAYECHATVSHIINEAVLAELERSGTDYSQLVTLSLNGEGEITSVQSNTVNINRLKSNVNESVEREIKRLSDMDIRIPVGTLLGVELLHGKGFTVGMSVKPVGYADLNIISEFTDAGINQTIHRIVIEISADVDALIPGYRTRVTVKTAIVAAETVIVGRVPDAYTHVVTGSGDIAGLINDYGAENYK